MSFKKISLLIGIGCLLFFLFLFELFSVILKTSWIDKFDIFWIGCIRGETTPEWGSILSFLTHLGSVEFVILMTLLIGVIFLYKKKFVFGLWFVSTIAISCILLKLLKEWVRRPRPDIDGWLIHASGFSYPSGHSVASSIFYGLLALFFIAVFQKLYAKIIFGILCLLFILFMMYARVYLGVHFPSDVLGGFLLGNSLAFFSMGFYFLFFKKI
ncbi:phosphatase PAP2 family protein [Helicobacter sp. 12S02232-10]|uniref:phosphatase PAP2 family protein n=1 Tax=Helicobacter sp. 12S02232-10 TaxID=1476197 RepID=UPI000BA7A962|nr:phosphatase PAP2 family protein [Helicobacter sp. 12S02232-10]